MKSALFYFLVLRNNDGNVFFGIIHEDVTSFLVVDDKSDASQSFYELIPGKCFAQRQTSISLNVAFGTVLI